MTIKKIHSLKHGIRPDFVIDADVSKAQNFIDKMNDSIRGSNVSFLDRRIHHTALHIELPLVPIVHHIEEEFLSSGHGLHLVSLRLESNQVFAQS